MSLADFKTVWFFKVVDKFGGQVGQEKVQELLGMDKSSTSFLFEEEKKDENFLKQM